MSYFVIRKREGQPWRVVTQRLDPVQAQRELGAPSAVRPW